MLHVSQIETCIFDVFWIGYRANSNFAKLCSMSGRIDIYEVIVFPCISFQLPNVKLLFQLISREPKQLLCAKRYIVVRLHETCSLIIPINDFKSFSDFTTMILVLRNILG
jgi:hypothetical protein